MKTPISHRAWKLGPEQKTFIHSQKALGRSGRQIAEDILTNYGIQISHVAVDRVARSPDAKQSLERARHAFETELWREPIASKRNRVKLLGQVCDLAMELEQFDTVIKAVSEARKEVEGPKLEDGGINLLQQNIYTNMSLKDLRTEKARLLKLKEYDMIKIEGTVSNEGDQNASTSREDAG